MHALVRIRRHRYINVPGDSDFTWRGIHMMKLEADLLHQTILWEIKESLTGNRSTAVTSVEKGSAIDSKGTFCR